MKFIRQFSLLIIPLILFASVGISFSQAPTLQASSSDAETIPSVTIKPSPTPGPSPTPKAGFIKNIARDQKAIWLSPFRLKRADIKWLAPLALTTTALLLTDRETSSWVSRNGSLHNISHYVSFGGSVYATAGFATGLYLIGRTTHDPRAEQTGKLALEALIDTAPVIWVLKNSMGRQRPNAGSGSGRFFAGGRAFPSGHSASAWAVATVVAYEYRHRPLIKYGAFAIAAAISLSRYSGRNHFLGDVFAGSAIGFGIGRFVYVSHH